MYLDKTIAKPPFSEKGGLNMCLLRKHGFSEKPVGKLIEKHDIRPAHNRSLLNLHRLMTGARGLNNELFHIYISLLWLFILGVSSLLCLRLQRFCD